MTEHEKLQQHILKRFQIKKKLGNGAYGIVWKVVDIQTNIPYALKKNFDAFQNSTDAQRTYRQIMFLQKFNHKNIVSLKEVIRSSNQKDIYILFEIMDADLYTLIRQNLLKQQHKRYITYQIALAMHYIHSADLIHRDIKPSNILVNEDCQAKICDFGLVRSINAINDQNEVDNALTDYIATRWYRAPQILLGSKKYSKAADVWSFGCLLGELMTGKPMFPGHSTLNQIERVITWTGPPTIDDLNSLKTDFGRQMLDLLTKIKPINRKQWLSNCSIEGYELLCKTLSFNPQKRPTMLQVARHPYLKDFYNKKQLIDCLQKFKLQVSDAMRLSLKEYRTLIYKIVDQFQQKMNNDSKNMINSSQLSHNVPNSTIRTLYKSRDKGIRSASKGKQDSIPKNNPRESQTVNIKKYGSYISNQKEPFRSKYLKTEQIAENNIFKKKKSDHTVKYFTHEKKKKSISLNQKTQMLVIKAYEQKY